MIAVIIEDEPQARMLLKSLIKEYAPSIDSIFEAENLKEGVDLLEAKSPDIVFLDIEMPGESGTMISSYINLEEQDFHLIFTTAYSDYAIKAFEMNAIDYLLKPIRPEQIKKAVKKVEKSTLSEKVERLKSLEESIKSEKFRKIAIPISEGFVFVNIEEIVCLEADGMYTKIKFKEKNPIIASKPMKTFVELLEDQGNFIRSHRSHFVNINYITQFIRRDGNYLIMENGDQVPVSRDKKDNILKLIASL